MCLHSGYLLSLPTKQSSNTTLQVVDQACRSQQPKDQVAYKLAKYELAAGHLCHYISQWLWQAKKRGVKGLQQPLVLAR